MQEAKKKFRDFLVNFVSDIPEEGGEPSIADHTEPYYMQRLEEVDYIIITSLHPILQIQYVPIVPVSENVVALSI